MIAFLYSQRKLESFAVEGDSPVGEMQKWSRMFLSKVGHEKSGPKLGGPPSKAK